MFNGTRINGTHILHFMKLVTPIVGVCNCSMVCCALLYIHSGIAIILVGKRELVVLLNLSSWCLVTVDWLFLVVPWGCLRFVIVVFLDDTHLLFFNVDSRHTIDSLKILMSLVRTVQYSCKYWVILNLNCMGKACILFASLVVHIHLYL